MSFLGFFFLSLLPQQKCYLFEMNCWRRRRTVINDTKIISHAVWTYDTRIPCNTSRGRSISRSLLDLHKAFSADGLIATTSKVNIGRIILHVCLRQKNFFCVCVCVYICMISLLPGNKWDILWSHCTVSNKAFFHFLIGTFCSLDFDFWVFCKD